MVEDEEDEDEWLKTKKNRGIFDYITIVFDSSSINKYKGIYIWFPFVCIWFPLVKTCEFGSIFFVFDPFVALTSHYTLYSIPE